MIAADNAGCEHWRVKEGSEFTDRHGAGALESRPGWARVRQQILGGHATGVVVISAFIAAVSEVAGRR
ncbi:hypothetical protein PUR34_19985 [Streptomyces sp. JV185]|uniref:hypothetical protein n=1 Tax=Streptomyces sp. JV185 TaxID=858638 RepID=UPI002E788D76|nr:hypothetical protein [Streptomyces sp. JV185]MEE1770352.1 hypothetical protein [Streptomyces sp. JV185]